MKRQAGALKALFVSRTTWRSLILPGTTFDYQREVGDITAASTITAPLFWMARTFPEAPAAIWRRLPNGQKERVFRHALLDLLERPNPFYTAPQLWAATVIDYMVDGNAYWIKQRNRAGAVTQIWWTPHWLIEPVSVPGSDVFIDHYLYRPGDQVVRLPVEDVVHFRFGLDGADPRFGISPLRSVLREVFTDNEAANFTAALLRNMGVPGVMVSPEKGVTIDPNEAEETKKTLTEKFTGDKRGEPIVMTGATKIEQFGFSPEQLLLRELRRIPEERVTAVLGVPAIVAGLGAGLDRSTFTNMAEAREAAYESGIIPMQRNLGEDVRFQLLRDFGANPFDHRFGFDLTEVRVLQEDEFRVVQRMDLAYRSGIVTRLEARREIGLDVDEARDNVFYQPLNATTVAADGGQPANGNGAGDFTAEELARELARLQPQT
jgi:HK97 family phage portal protein